MTDADLAAHARAIAVEIDYRGVDSQAIHSQNAALIEAGLRTVYLQAKVEIEAKVAGKCSETAL